MKTDTYTPIIIFSHNRNDLGTLANENNGHLMREFLAAEGISYKEVEGVYKGARENSYIASEDYLSVILPILKQFNQECYLFSDQFRETWYVNCNTGEETYLGQLQAVSKQEAEKCDSYTFNPEDNTYWIAK